MLVLDLIEELDCALKVLTGATGYSRPTPVCEGLIQHELSSKEVARSASLMRVNHTGEVCAQALYSGQKILESDVSTREALAAAASEELDHLKWTAQRLEELGTKPSRFNSIFYFGSFGLGVLASLAGKEKSLGFLLETERQVEVHLDQHQAELPKSDLASREIVRQMMIDEARHAQSAVKVGAIELPEPIKNVMRVMSKIMIFISSRG